MGEDVSLDRPIDGFTVGRLLTTLIFGVSDIPYSEPAEAPVKQPKRRAKPIKPKVQTVTTTGQVAEILEAKYGVMRAFFDRHEADIAKDLEDGVGHALEAVLRGAPPSMDVFGPATQLIGEKFKDFLTNKEMDGMVAGVPTQASLLGISHRFKGKRGAPGRPSFVDTGTFEANFRTWVEDK